MNPGSFWPTWTRLRLSPKGIFEKSKLTKEFLESKIKEYNKLEEEIHILQKEKEELDKLSSK